MFKSLFSKYVAAFMTIIIITFTIVHIITFAVVGRYSTEEKKREMENCAEASRAYVLSMMHGEDSQALEQTVKNNHDDVLQTLDWISHNISNTDVLLFDGEGRLLLRAGSGSTKINEQEAFPVDIKNTLDGGLDYYSTHLDDGMFEEVRILFAIPIVDGGSVFGSVIVCTEKPLASGLVNLISRIVLGSILWVLLATLIAIYFISERVNAPLREISSAAKWFASGKFDVRVPVRGNDEITELAVAFNNMAESLDNYDDMRNSFMSNVSHDLRSPMTSISGFIDGILDGVIPPEQHKYYLQIVASEVKRLSRLVNSLLDLSRIQAGERKFTPLSFDICEMSRQILISFEQKIDSKKLDVEFNCESDKINVFADPDAIYQVLYNLCDNAVKFAFESGKLAINIKTLKGKKISVEVYNEGQGISVEDINYVFERFYKSDKSRGLNKQGAGLGLFISKTIIDAHNEQIKVESEYGKNCSFTFTLERE